METSNISMIIVLNKMHFYYNVIIAMFEVNIICIVCIVKKKHMHICVLTRSSPRFKSFIDPFTY
jgi:hypothetical protein